MPKKVKRYLITTETHEIFVVRRERAGIRGFCRECGKTVEMHDLDAAVGLTGKTARQIFYAIENGAIHSLETTQGHLLVCRESLFGS